MTTMIEKCDAIVASGAAEIRLSMREAHGLLVEISTTPAAHDAKWTEGPMAIHPRQNEPGFRGTYKGVPIFQERTAKGPTP